jgi:DNA polymerase III epsilon subunit-like protein
MLINCGTQFHARSSNSILRHLGVAHSSLFPNFKIVDAKNRYIEVPYKEKDTAKALGAKWDYKRTKWYVPMHLNIGKFGKWMRIPLSISDATDMAEIQRLGAHRDSLSKSWYITGDQNVELFAKWISFESHAAFSPQTATFGQNDSRRNFFAFLDLETNSLPGKGETYKEYTCRIVQISCMLCEGAQTLEEKLFEDIIIKSDGFAIENSEFHNISLERSLAEGINFNVAVDRLFTLLRQAGSIIIHNADFDINVLKSELHRHGYDKHIEELEQMRIICTMKSTVQLVKAVGKTNRLKYPNLKEFYQFSTGKEAMHGHHNSKHDVLNLHEAVQSLVQQNLLSIA